MNEHWVKQPTKKCPHETDMYLSKLQILFVWIAKYICSNVKLYFPAQLNEGALSEAVNQKVSTQNWYVFV